MKVTHECEACDGTGLYSGMCEAKGEAVVCSCCAGLGFVTDTFRAFKGRRKRRGIKVIRISRGSFLATGVGGTGKPMTYAEFEKMFPREEP